MQIQRIQTVYILLAAILMCVFAFVPMLRFPAVGEGECVTFAAVDELGTLLPVALTAVFLLVDIFLYNNLPLQRKFLCFCMGMTVISYGVVAYMAYDSSASLTLWNLLLVGAWVLEYLGLRGIRHDQNLLRSSDRIR